MSPTLYATPIVHGGAGVGVGAVQLPPVAVGVGVVRAVVVGVGVVLAVAVGVAVPVVHAPSDAHSEGTEPGVQPAAHVFVNVDAAWYRPLLYVTFWPCVYVQPQQ